MRLIVISVIVKVFQMKNSEFEKFLLENKEFYIGYREKMSWKLSIIFFLCIMIVSFMK